MLLLTGVFRDGALTKLGRTDACLGRSVSAIGVAFVPNLGTLDGGPPTVPGPGPRLARGPLGEVKGPPFTGPTEPRAPVLERLEELVPEAIEPRLETFVFGPDVISFVIAV